MTARIRQPDLIVLNQMAGPLTWELVEDLARKGTAVELLTGHPDSLAKGSRHHLQLHKSFSYQRGSLARRAISWSLYLAHAFFWLWKFPARTPLLVFSNPPMLVWLAALTRRLRGTRFCVMVHDIYPDLPVRMGHLSTSGVPTRCWQRLNRWAYNQAEEVLTLGEYMSQAVSQQFDVARTRSKQVQVIYPWADTERIRPLEKTENPFAQAHGQTDRLTVMYSGNLGLGHDIETMLAATKHLPDAAHFMFIGAGPKWSLVQDYLRTTNPQNITLLGWLPEDEIPYSLATADLALVSLESEVAGLAIPSKAFYSLATGTPLVVIADHDTELAEIVRQHQCGWRVSPGDDQHLARIVSDMLDHPEKLQQFKRAARSTSEAIGAREKNATTFVGVLERCLLRRGTTTKRTTRSAETYRSHEKLAS